MNASSIAVRQAFDSGDNPAEARIPFLGSKLMASFVIYLNTPARVFS
jgi:hypothetical protein